MDCITLVTVNEQLVVDSRLIAQGLGIQHKNVYQAIKDNQEDMESTFGRVLFQTETLNTAGGMQKVKFAYLNEDQATYLMTLSRNTPQVKTLKLNLVKSFAEYKKQSKSPNELSRKDILLMALQAEEEKLLLQSQVEEQKLLIESKEQTIDAQQEIIVEWHPLVKNYKQFMDTDGLLSMAEAAKMLSEETGRNKLIKVLRLLGIFIQNPNKREPYQKYMKHFRMKAKLRDSVSSDGTRKADVVTLFTPEGFNSILRIMINKCDSEEQLMEYLKKPSLLDLKLKKQKAEKDNRLSEVEDDIFSLLD